MKAALKLFSGREVDLLSISEEDIDIYDIAHGLACINRFNGQCRVPVSVAQHSVYVARLVEKMGGNKSDMLHGLLHDAAEAYIGDMTKWLKSLPQMEFFCDLEEQILLVIHRKFGIERHIGALTWPGDRLMVRYEGEEGWKHTPETPFRIDHPSYPPTSQLERDSVGAWKPWSWQVAEEVFLDLFHYLTDQHYRRLRPESLIRNRKRAKTTATS